jgi:hypothetical protein
MSTTHIESDANNYQGDMSKVQQEVFKLEGFS